MTTLLHIDASARPGRSGETEHGSHSRRLSARFVSRWRELDPGTEVIYRDVGQQPPAPVTADWIHAAFTPAARREAWMHEVLAESDALVDELVAADVIVAGIPMYNFGPPAQFKAWIDNTARVGRTFGFDRSRGDMPYWPMLAEMGKRLVILSSRGDFGYEPGQRMAAYNHVEASVRSPLAYFGITDVHGAAIEYDEFGGERLANSIAQAERDVDALAAHMVAASPGVRRRAAA